MGGRGDGEVGRTVIRSRRGDCDDVIGRQPICVDIHDPAGSGDAAVAVKHRRGQAVIEHQATAIGIQEVLIVSEIALSVDAASPARWVRRRAEGRSGSRAGERQRHADGQPTS